ncbi:MAG: DUF885 domain-containing protein [Saprospiraceae bacterium]|nr:DUF885 domain-containing protein [Saprospiraceae bacterium]
MRLIYLTSISLLLFSCRSEKENASEALHELFAEEWAYRLQEFPTFATYTGFHDYNDRLPDVSEEAYRRRADYWRNCLTELASIDREALDRTDQINYDLFKYVLEDDIAQVEFEAYLIPVNSEGGFYSELAFVVGQMPFAVERDYDIYLQRLAAIPSYFGQHIALMQEGLDKGMTTPQVILEGYEQTINAHLVDDPANSPFYRPFLEMPEEIPAERRETLQQEAARVISEKVIPAYRQLSAFMADSYYPGARTTIGATDLPNGQAYYEQRVRYFTTLPYSADEIFRIGQEEVARIRESMQAIIEQLEFEGSFADFLQFLRTDPQFYAQTPQELLSYASFLAKKIDGRLPQVFDRLPSLPYGVEPVPGDIAPRYTAGRYVEGSYKNHKAGTYWVNTYKLDSRPLYVLPALTLHEAVPGHHLQISLTQELGELPLFRQNLYLSAYGEGWGLYSEWLGQELGMYETPYENFGRLTYEMWRACRLVVDVGIHAKGWTRDQAVDFMASNTALSLHEVNTEINRYIGWPAQALSYKIGELKIRELRQKSKEALGDRFDLREFHNVVLLNGSVPLFVLERIVGDYVAEKR